MRWSGRLPVLAGTAAGVAAALVLTLLQSSTYRADVSIALVRQGQPPGDDPALARAAEAAAELFHSRAVAEPAIANLRLDESPAELLDRVSVETAAESSLIRISVEAPSRDEARRTAQELTELMTVRFNDRFGPATAATVWEAPRADEDRVSPRPARNLALGALFGALLGALASAVAGRRRAAPTAGHPREPRLEALAAELAERTAALDERVRSITARELALARRAARAAVPASPSFEEAAAEPEPEPEPEPAPVPVPVQPEPLDGAPATLWRLEQLVAAKPSEDVYVQSDREATLFLLRDYAGVDGRIPQQFDGLVWETFGELLDG